MQHDRRDRDLVKIARIALLRLFDDEDGLFLDVSPQERRPENGRPTILIQHDEVTRVLLPIHSAASGEVRLNLLKLVEDGLVGANHTAGTPDLAAVLVVL